MAGLTKTLAADVRGTFTRRNLVQNAIIAAIFLIASPLFHFYARLDWPYLVPALVGAFLLLAVGLHKLRSRAPKESASVPGVFAVETIGHFGAARIYSGEPLITDRFLLTLKGFRITNRQTDSPLSVDLRLHLPEEAAGTNEPARGIRSLPDDIPPEFLSTPLICPFRVEPGDTVIGDAVFVLQNPHLNAWLDGGGSVRPRLGVIDYVSNRYIELAQAQRFPDRSLQLDAAQVSRKENA